MTDAPPIAFASIAFSDGRRLACRMTCTRPASSFLLTSSPSPNVGSIVVSSSSGALVMTGALRKIIPTCEAIAVLTIGATMHGARENSSTLSSNHDGRPSYCVPAT